MDQQDWSRINIQGFVPLIYKIEPVNMPALLGLYVSEKMVGPVALKGRPDIQVWGREEEIA